MNYKEMTKKELIAELEERDKNLTRVFENWSEAIDQECRKKLNYRNALKEIHFIVEESITEDLLTTEYCAVLMKRENRIFDICNKIFRANFDKMFKENI